jgi:hypothetical protein
VSAPCSRPHPARRLASALSWAQASGEDLNHSQERHPHHHRPLARDHGAQGAASRGVAGTHTCACCVRDRVVCRALLFTSNNPLRGCRSKREAQLVDSCAVRLGPSLIPTQPVCSRNHPCRHPQSQIDGNPIPLQKSSREPCKRAGRDVECAAPLLTRHAPRASESARRTFTVGPSRKARDTTACQQGA